MIKELSLFLFLSFCFFCFLDLIPSKSRFLSGESRSFPPNNDYNLFFLARSVHGIALNVLEITFIVVSDKKSLRSRQIRRNHLFLYFKRDRFPIYRHICVVWGLSAVLCDLMSICSSVGLQSCIIQRFKIINLVN